MSERKSNPKKRRRELPAISDDHFNNFNKIRQKYNATWAEVFERLHNYEDWVEHFFNLPLKPSDTDKINAVTVVHLLPLWLEHIYQNFIRDNIHVNSLSELINTRQKASGLVIANGPSLNDDNLKRLSNSTFYRDKKGIIVSTAHDLKACIAAGVVPNYVVLIDAAEIEADWIDIDAKYARDITGIFLPSVHPEALKRWKGKKYFYLSVVPDITIPNVQGVLVNLFPMFMEFDGGSNCGTVCWNIARLIGCTQIAVLGLDFAFDINTPVQETQYYEAFRKSYNSDEEMLKKVYRFHTHSFFKTNCYTDANFDNFRKIAEFLFKEAKKRGIETINCSPGVIDLPEVENMWFKDWLAKWEKGR